VTRSIRRRAFLRLTDTVVLILAVVSCRAEDSSREPDADHRQGIVELALGESDGPEEYTFARVSGLVADRRGRIYVADFSAHSVRVFDPGGRFLYRIGRKGQGPGEFSGPCCLALRDDDRTLWVRDGGNARYTSFTLGDTGAVYRSAIRMAHGDVNRFAPLGFDASGNLIDVGALPSSAAPGSRGTSRVGRFHVDSTGRVVGVDTVPEPPPDSAPVHVVRRTTGRGSVTLFFLYQPFGAFPLTAHSSAGEFAHAVSSRYSVAWRAPDGRLLRTLERGVEGPLLSQAERARGEEEIAQDLRRLSLGRGELPFDVPARKPPLRSLFFDQDGRLWLQHSVPDGAPPSADVYAADGRLLYRATWPRLTDLSNGAARGDVVYGVQRDSLDTPRIVRIRLTRATGGADQE
jgi:sugar lactone lactonase YvrE